MCTAFRRLSEQKFFAKIHSLTCKNYLKIQENYLRKYAIQMEILHTFLEKIIYENKPQSWRKFLQKYDHILAKMNRKDMYGPCIKSPYKMSPSG